MTTIAADVAPQSAPEGTTILRLPSVWKFSMVSALNGPSPNLKTPPPSAMAAMRTAVEPQRDDRGWSDYQDNTGAGWEKQGAENPLGLGVLRQRIHTPDLTSQTHWYLVIPGVDEDVWAYINGELVAEQSWANTGMTPDDLWNYPLVAELTGKLASDTDVLLALGIFNRAGMGGLYTSVYLVGADRELTAGEAVTALSEGNPYGYATLFRRKFAANDQIYIIYTDGNVTDENGNPVGIFVYMTDPTTGTIVIDPATQLPTTVGNIIALDGVTPVFTNVDLGTLKVILPTNDNPIAESSASLNPKSSAATPASSTGIATSSAATPKSSSSGRGIPDQVRERRQERFRLRHPLLGLLQAPLRMARTRRHRKHLRCQGKHD